MSVVQRSVLATDLDGTFAHGPEQSRTLLLDLLAQGRNSTLIYVTGRTPDAVRSLSERVALPEPDILIADVGTSVLHGLGPERLQEIEAQLDALWCGAQVVRDRLAAVPDLVPQDVIAPRRVSWWIEPVRRIAAAHGVDPFAARQAGDPALTAEAEVVADAVAGRVREALAGLHVDILVSANVFLDVLPRGVDKGSTLRRVLNWLDAADDACIVAGDSLNDLALFQLGVRGIVVGNCEPALRRRVAGLAGIYQASGHGVDGVLEGLRHHGFLRNEPDPGHDHGG